jgi:hypothetical protein
VRREGPCDYKARYVAAKRSTESALQFDIGMTPGGHSVLDFQGNADRKLRRYRVISSCLTAARGSLRWLSYI